MVNSADTSYLPVEPYASNDDKAGNRTSQVINGTPTTFNYNAANQLTSTSQGTTYSYDANGNETSISTGNVLIRYKHDE